MSEEAGLLRKSHTIGHILCCRCGTQITPNGANMCAKCVCSESEPTKGLPSRVTIIHCPDCVRYLQPPTTWVRAERESKELLTICLKKLKKLSEFRLIDAKFVFTEPNCKRLKVEVRVQKEVLHRVYVEKPHTIEYVVLYQKCPLCMPADPNHWEAVVQVRQHVSHMKTFFYLEQLIIKHNAVVGVVRIKQIHEGVDFFFAKKKDAIKFFDLLCKVVPIKPQNFHKQLVSQDSKSNICRYRFSIAATICPICHDDVIYLPRELSSTLGHLGPLVICTKVRNTITLLDPFTLQEYNLAATQYWRAPFEAILSSRQLVEYTVLDVEIDSSGNGKGNPKYALAEVQIARVSDFGKNDTIFSVKTHLGHLLNPGDFALGYDLYAANLDSQVEKYKASLPDVVLVKKKYERKQQSKPRKNSSSEYQQFLRDLDVNPESRFNVSLYPENMDDSSSLASGAKSVDELEDVFADLDLSDTEDFI